MNAEQSPSPDGRFMRPQVTRAFGDRGIQMDSNLIRDRIRPWLEKALRPAWVPIVKSGDGMLSASKFSGRPWLGSNEKWPVCSGCEKPLQLFLQLNLTKLPKGLKGRFGDGLLQLFYCRNDNDDCPASDRPFEPFADSHFIRVVHPAGRSSRVTLPDDSGYYPARRIIRWQRIDDWPSFSDLEECGVSYEFNHIENTVTLRWAKPKLELEIPDYTEFAKGLVPCRTGEKLFGWPYWLQDPQRPECPKCGKRMQFVFQFDSQQKNIPYSFGDLGTAQLHQCAKHKDVLAFGWAGC